MIVPLLLSLRGSSGVLLCGVEVSYPGLISLLTVPRPEELGDLLKVATLGESRAESVSLGFAMPGCLWAGGGVRWLPPQVSSSPPLGRALQGEQSEQGAEL